MPSLTPERRKEIEEKLAATTELPDKETARSRYSHGGGRMSVQGDTRTLVLDVYEEGDREFYFHAKEITRDLLSALAEAEGKLEKYRALFVDHDRNVQWYSSPGVVGVWSIPASAVAAIEEG